MGRMFLPRFDYLLPSASRSARNLVSEELDLVPDLAFICRNRSS